MKASKHAENNSHLTSGIGNNLARGNTGGMTVYITSTIGAGSGDIAGTA